MRYRTKTFIHNEVIKFEAPRLFLCIGQLLYGVCIQKDKTAIQHCGNAL